MTTPTRTSAAATLATLIDEILAGDWESPPQLVTMNQTARRLVFVDLDVLAPWTTREIPAPHDADAVAATTLGWARRDDGVEEPRKRVRLTVAADQEDVAALLRTKGGRTQAGETTTRLVGDLRRWAGFDSDDQATPPSPGWPTGR